MTCTAVAQSLKLHVGILSVLHFFSKVSLALCHSSDQSWLGLALRIGLGPSLEVDELALVVPLLATGVLVDARRPQLHAEHGRRLQVARVPFWVGQAAVMLSSIKVILLQNVKSGY